MFKMIVRKIKIKFEVQQFIINMCSTQPISKVFGFDKGTPIDRFYIENFFKNNSSAIIGNVLEVAESTYSRKYGTNVTSFQILHYDKFNTEATITGDLAAPDTLPVCISDCFVCSQTLNFIYDVKSAIISCHQLLTVGGVFLGTVSGISQISRYDMDRWGDYWRFTDLSIKRMFDEVFGIGNVEVIVYGNAFAATAFIQGLAIEEITNIEKLVPVDEDYQVIIGIRAVKC